MPAERLQKVLARAGVASRRAAETLIVDGRVTVNDEVAQLGASADPDRDEIAVDGQRVHAAPPAIHLAVHKPAGILSSARDERGRRSVVSLVSGDLPTEIGRLWPAGRLDVESEGLMLLTNDGEWANRVLHPRYGVEREYAVLVDPPPDPDTLRQLRRGVELEDGPTRLLAARIASPPPEVERERGDRGVWLRVRVSEGRKREVRRIFEAAGHRVQRLVRTAVGPIVLGGLRQGEWRALRAEEAAAVAGKLPSNAPAPIASRRRVPTRTRPLAVAIDGPSGAGKSTVGHALAQRIGANFVDTGLMYRALTLAAVEAGVNPDDEAGLAKLAATCRIHVRRPRPMETDRLETVLLGRRDVTHEVRTPRIDRIVSAVSRHRGVRRAMVAAQRATARAGDTVMVGRDIGTVVLPSATLKVYLTATKLVRAARRAREMGRPDRVEAYLAEIEERDAADSGREVAPLRVAPGALVVDTGELDVEACVEAIVQHLKPQKGRRPR
jgi:23S rRNA pseudouridine2605 synthase